MTWKAPLSYYPGILQAFWQYVLPDCTYTDHKSQLGTISVTGSMAEMWPTVQIPLGQLVSHQESEFPQALFKKNYDKKNLFIASQLKYF